MENMHTDNRLYMVKFTVSLISLSFVHLFAFLTILTIAANKCKEHIKCVQLLTL